MKVVGIEQMSKQQLLTEIQNGGKFVFYHYCISIILMSFKRSSDIYFIPAGESRIKKGLIFSLVSFLLGWWGIPWGPFFTITSFVTNFGGGEDVTTEVARSIFENDTVLDLSHIKAW